MTGWSPPPPDGSQSGLTRSCCCPDSGGTGPAAAATVPDPGGTLTPRADGRVRLPRRSDAHPHHHRRCCCYRQHRSGRRQQHDRSGCSVAQDSGRSGDFYPRRLKATKKDRKSRTLHKMKELNITTTRIALKKTATRSSPVFFYIFHPDSSN